MAVGLYDKPECEHGTPSDRCATYRHAACPKCGTPMCAGCKARLDVALASAAPRLSGKAEHYVNPVLLAHRWTLAEHIDCCHRLTVGSEGHACGCSCGCETKCSRRKDLEAAIAAIEQQDREDDLANDLERVQELNEAFLAKHG